MEIKLRLNFFQKIECDEFGCNLLVNSEVNRKYSVNRSVKPTVSSKMLKIRFILAVTLQAEILLFTFETINL